MIRMRKNPGIVKSPAANTNTSAAGLLEHLPGRLRGRYVAIPDDGDGRHGFHDSSDSSKVDNTGKALFPRSAMNKNGRGARSLECPSQIRRGDVILIPTQSHFRRDRNL